MATKMTWQQRAIEHRKAAVLEVVNRPEGEPVRRAIKRISAKYNGRTLPGGKHLKLARPTLRSLFYAYKAEASEKAFDFHYATPFSQPSLHPWIIRLFVDYAIHHGFSILHAHRALKVGKDAFPFSVRSVYRHLSATDRQRINRAVALRKKIKNSTQELETITNKNRRVS